MKHLIWLLVVVWSTGIWSTTSFGDTPEMQTQALEISGNGSHNAQVHQLQQTQYQLNDLNHHAVFILANYSVDHQAITCAGDHLGHAYCLPTEQADDIFHDDFERSFCYQTLYHSNLEAKQRLFFHNTHTHLPPLTPDTHGEDSLIVFSNYDGYPSPPGPYNNNDHEIWVTNRNDFQQATQQLICNNPDQDPADIAMRFNELLGLAPDESNSAPRHVITAIVPQRNDYQSDGVFRPCMSGYNTSRSCQANPTEQEQSTPYFSTWAINQYLQANQPGKETLWTGQGYTYDWGISDNNHVGVPEYIIAKDTSMYIQRNDSLATYLHNTCHR